MTDLNKYLDTRMKYAEMYLDKYAVTDYIKSPIRVEDPRQLEIIFDE